jgi:hypothetical protein
MKRAHVLLATLVVTLIMSATAAAPLSGCAGTGCEPGSDGWLATYLARHMGDAYSGPCPEEFPESSAASYFPPRALDAGSSSNDAIDVCVTCLVNNGCGRCVESDGGVDDACLAPCQSEHCAMPCSTADGGPL